MTPEQIIAELAALITALPLRKQGRAEQLLTAVREIWDRQNNAIQTMYDNVVVLHSFQGAGKKPLVN